jgi:hypothetical protein
MKLSQKKPEENQHSWVKPLFEGLKPRTLQSLSVPESSEQNKFLEWAVKDGKNFPVVGIPTTHRTEKGRKVGIMMISFAKTHTKVSNKTFNTGRYASWKIATPIREQRFRLMMDFATQVPHELLATCDGDEAFTAAAYSAVNFEAKEYPPSLTGNEADNLTIFDNCVYNCGFNGKSLSEQGVDLSVFLELSFFYLRNLDVANAHYTGTITNNCHNVFQDLTFWLPEEAL